MFQAPQVVEKVCTGWLGMVGGILAVFGVVATPITSGDTAFRSARLIIAEALHVDQKKMSKRVAIALPIFAAAIALLYWQIENKDGFNTLWQWFGWSNQTLAVFMLWAITVYLVQQKKLFVITLIPAIFMTMVCSTFLLISPMAFHLGPTISYIGCGIVFVVATLWFVIWYRKYNSNHRL